MNIILKKIKKKPEEIAVALTEYDEEFFTEEIISYFKDIIPSQEEYEKVFKKIDELPEETLEDPESIDPCDIFIYLVGGLPGVQYRTTVMNFKLTYRRRSIEILDIVKSFIEFFEFLKTNEHFVKFLTVLLVLGNYMNGTGAKGGAYGFGISSLTTFFNLISNNKKSNLFEYAIFSIIDDLKQPEILDIVSYLNLADECMFFLIFSD